MPLHDGAIKASITARQIRGQVVEIATLTADAGQGWLWHECGTVVRWLRLRLTAFLGREDIQPPASSFNVHAAQSEDLQLDC